LRQLGILILLPALVLAGVGCGRRGSGSSSSEARAVGPDWRQKTSYAYALKLNGDAKLPSGAAAFSLELTAELDLQVVDSDGNRTRLRGVLRNPSMKLGGAADAEANQVSEELKQPALLAFERGQVKDAWYSPGLSGVSMSTWRTIGAAMQISEPTAPAPRWEAEEYDSAGRYRAEYTTGPSLVRKKTAYLSVLEGTPGRGAVPPEFMPKINTAETRFGLELGSLKSVEHRESVTTTVEQHSTLTVVTSVSLQLLPSSPAVEAFDARTFVARAQHAPPEKPAPRPKEAGPAAFDQARMEGQSLPALFDFFDKHPKNASAPPDEPAQKDKKPAGSAKGASSAQAAAAAAAASALTQERTSKMGALIAFLRSDPTALALALAKIRANAPSAPTLLSAMASAETPAAQAALLALLRDPTVPKPLKGYTLIDIAFITRPEPDVATVLTSLLPAVELAPSVLITLGSVSRRLRDAGRTEEVEVIRPSLARSLAEAKDERAREDALRAIANSGDAALLPVVKPYLTAASPGERASAAEALRHMKLGEVEGLLAERLAVDAAPQVSLAVLQTMRTRGASPESVAALTKAISGGSTPNVRQRAVELAGSWLKQYPTLRPALTDAAEKDPDEHVRAAASHAI